MSTDDPMPSLEKSDLESWQAAFAASFFDHSSPAYHLLEGPPGTGKTHTGAVIASEAVGRGAARVLVLSPAALSTQWAAILDGLQAVIPVSVVTGPLLREMVAEQPIGESPWNVRGIFIVSYDLAKQPTVEGSISENEWDLVIVDEAHLIRTGRRAALLEKLIANSSVRRLLLLSTPSQQLEDWLDRTYHGGRLGQQNELLNSLKVTHWSLSVVPPTWGLIGYRRGADELRFLEGFFKALPSLVAATDSHERMVWRLTRLAASSLFALEESLRRLRTRLNARDEHLVGKILASTGDAPDENDADPEVIQTLLEGGPGDWVDTAAGIAVIDECLESLEAVSTDEKLDALRNVIATRDDVADRQSPRICICSSYAETLSYLQAATADLMVPVVKITGEVSAEESIAAFDAFVRDGGIMLVTDAGAQGFEFPHTDLVMHYDLPPTPRALEFRLQRFNRLGPKPAAKMLAFQDESGAISFEARQLDELIASQTGGPSRP